MKRIVGLALVLVLLCSVFVASAEVLRQGSKGELVRALQVKLHDLGYDVGKIDGVYGKLLHAAVWRYQNEVGLKADGIAGAQTLTHLGIKSSGSTVAVPPKGLTIGDEGPIVASLQGKLNDLGYLANSPSGSYDYATWLAVWTFQRDKSITANGVADSKVLSALGLSGSNSESGDVLSYGSTGYAVMVLQTTLKHKGYYADVVDGIYGYQTYLAVFNFQRDQALRSDGIAGPKTLGRLGL